MKTQTAIVGLLIASAFVGLVPTGSALPSCVHPAVNHTVLCANRAPNMPSPICDNPIAVNTWANCSVYGSDADGDSLWAEIVFGDGYSGSTGTFSSGSYGYSGHSWSAAGTYCVQARTHDSYGGTSPWSNCWTETIIQPNRAPIDPGPPSVPNGGNLQRGVTYWFSSVTTDADGDAITYDFEFYQNGFNWQGYIWSNQPSGQTVSVPESFSIAGQWCAKVRVKDAAHSYGPFSGCAWFNVT